jgi:threonine synthase
MQASHVRHARCLRCGAEQPAAPLAELCTRCAPATGESGADSPDADPAILDVVYDYDAARPALLTAIAPSGPPSARRADADVGLFRWRALLPVDTVPPLPPTGDTPLLAAERLATRLGLGALHLKDETRNPTRCLKDRATAVAIARARAAGATDVYCASAGNAAISLAGYAAYAGLGCHVYVPHDASRTRLAWLEQFGADVHVSRGSYDDAFAEAAEAGARHGWYNRNCAYNPYLVEGKKTVAFEIAEQLDWQVPDVVAAPVGDGCTLGAIGKGFRELRALGLIDRLPRLVGAQAAALQPLVRRWRGEPPAPESGATRAASIKVRHPRNALRLLAELDAAGGALVAVEEEAIEAARRALGREAGVVAEFTSAAALAALERWAAERARAGERGLRAVVVVTGGRPDEL